MGPEEGHNGACPGVSFCFVYPRFGAEDAGHLEMPTDAYQKKNPHKNLFLLVKAPGKRQPSMTKNFWTITTLLQPTAQEKPWPHSHQ